MNYETKDVYAVFTNTNLTDGRGGEYIKLLTASPSVAEDKAKGNYIQGGDCPIRKVTLYRIHNRWYGPITLEYPNEQQIVRDKEIYEREEKERKRKEIIERVREHLNEDELKLLLEI